MPLPLYLPFVLAAVLAVRKWETQAEILNSLLYWNTIKLNTYFVPEKKTNHPTYINTGEEQFEQVNLFKYLGTMVNTDNSIEEQIKERIAAGNRA